MGKVKNEKTNIRLDGTIKIAHEEKEAKVTAEERSSKGGLKEGGGKPRQRDVRQQLSDQVPYRRRGPYFSPRGGLARRSD